MRHRNTPAVDALHSFCPFSTCILPVFTLEFGAVFLYSRYLSFAGYVVGKYFLPLHSLSFHLFAWVFCRTNLFNFDEVKTINFSLSAFFFCFSGPHLRHTEGSSWDRGHTGAGAASLHHSHSNTGSELHPRPIPHLTAMPDPGSAERGQGLNLHPHGYPSGLKPAEPQQEHPLFHVFGVKSENSLPSPRSKRFTPVFFLKCLAVYILQLSPGSV